MNEVAGYRCKGGLDVAWGWRKVSNARKQTDRGPDEGPLHTSLHEREFQVAKRHSLLEIEPPPSWVPINPAFGV